MALTRPEIRTAVARALGYNPAEWELRSPTALVGGPIALPNLTETVLDTGLVIPVAGTYRVEAGASIQKASGASYSTVSINSILHAGPLGTVGDPTVGFFIRHVSLAAAVGENAAGIFGVIHDAQLDAGDILTLSLTRTGDAANTWNVLRTLSEYAYTLRVYLIE